MVALGLTHCVCKVSPTRNQDAVALDLLAVLATLFSRERIHPDRAADSGLLASSRGSVVQADLPADCQAALDAYNSRMLRVVSGMARAAATLVPVNDRYSIYLLYWYTRTSTDAAAARSCRSTTASRFRACA